MKSTSAPLWATIFLFFCFPLSSSGWSHNLIDLVEGAHSVKVAVDRKGTTLALWEYSVGAKNFIRVGRLAEKGSWTLTPDLDLRPEKEYSLAQLGIDSEGNGIVLWNAVDLNTGLHSAEYSILYSKSKAWTVPAILSTVGSASTTHPKLAVSEKNTYFVWQCEVEGKTSVFGATLPNKPLNGPTAIPLSNPSGHSFFPTISANSAGQITVVWIGVDERFSHSNLKSASFDPTSSLWTERDITSITEINIPTSPEVAVDPAGNAIVVYFVQQKKGPSLIEGSIKKVDQDHWQATSTLGFVNLNKVVETPLVKVDRFGNAIAIWQNFAGGTTSFVEAARLPFGMLSWQQTQNISPSLPSIDKINLSVSPNGNALALISLEDQSSTYYSMFNFRSNSWSIPQEHVSKNGIIPAVMATNSLGQVAFVWGHQDSTLQSSFFSPPIIHSPVNLKGEKIEDHFLFRKETSNQISWTPPTSGEPPASYKVFRDAALTQLVGTFFTGSPLVLNDKSRQKGRNSSYYVVSVDAEGNMSEPAMITF